MSKRPSLTPLADLGRSAGQRPLHGLHAAGNAAGGDDAEVGARLPERLLVNVGLGGRILDDARLLGATSELLAKELLRALAALGRLCRLRCFTRALRAALRASASRASRAWTTVLRLTLAILAISVGVASGLALSAASARSRASLGPGTDTCACAGLARQLARELAASTAASRRAASHQVAAAPGWRRGLSWWCEVRD